MAPSVSSGNGRLFETAEIATFTPQEKNKLDNDMRTERDLRNQIAYAHDKGLEEGIEQGIERGRESERSRIKESLGRKGYSEEEIAKILES